MSRRQRRISLLVGVLFLVVFAWSFLASLEVILEELTSPTGVALVVGGLAMALGGLAFVIGGLTERVSVGGIVLEWWQFQSLGFVCLGLYMAVSGSTAVAVAVRNRSPRGSLLPGVRCLPSPRRPADERRRTAGLSSQRRRDLLEHRE
ncbi:hypothetical protein D8S78_06205 [Natrialba swarupiae]|nr:hypothetical protein [Natrialba swarupiae]